MPSERTFDHGMESVFLTLWGKKLILPFTVSKCFIMHCFAEKHAADKSVGSSEMPVTVAAAFELACSMSCLMRYA